MELVFHNYADVLAHVTARRDRSFNQLQAALNPPLGVHGAKITKASKDRLVGEVHILSLLVDELARAEFKG